VWIGEDAAHVAFTFVGRNNAVGHTQPTMTAPPRSKPAKFLSAGVASQPIECPSIHTALNVIPTHRVQGQGQGLTSSNAPKTFTERHNQVLFATSRCTMLHTLISRARFEVLDYVEDLPLFFTLTLFTQESPALSLRTRQLIY
jgi:hypothetical protein